MTDEHIDPNLKLFFFFWRYRRAHLFGSLRCTGSDLLWKIVQGERVHSLVGCAALDESHINSRLHFGTNLTAYAWPNMQGQACKRGGGHKVAPPFVNAR